MIIKAIIEDLPEQDDNHYTIRIPFLEDHTKNQVNFKALLSHTPGIYDSYQIGDVVFISFENEKLDMPIILGKLYTPWDIVKIGSANFSNISSDDGKLKGSSQKLLNKISTYNTTVGDNLNYTVVGEW